MNILRFFGRRRSAPVARERLQILLTHERGLSRGGPDLLAVLREEVLGVIGKHVSVQPDKVQVKLDRGKTVSMLEIDIEVPNPPEERGRRKAA